MSLGPTGASFFHYCFYHHTTAFHHFSLVVFFISFSLFYLLFFLLHILSTLSGDPPRFITWRIVTSFPLSIPWTLIPKTLGLRRSSHWREFIVLWRLRGRPSIMDLIIFGAYFVHVQGMCICIYVKQKKTKNKNKKNE